MHTSIHFTRIHPFPTLSRATATMYDVVVNQVRPMWPSETEDVVHVVQEQVVVVKEPAS